MRFSLFASWNGIDKPKRMDILQLTPQVPFPLSDGGKVGIFNITKHLALRGHRITMLALDRTPEIDPAPLKEYCNLIRISHSNKNSIGGVTRNLFSTLPYSIAKYKTDTYGRALKELLQAGSFDVVHADHLHMAQYADLCRSTSFLPIVLREHNVESIIVQRFARDVRLPVFRQWIAMQAKRMRVYEAELVRRFDACCAITAEDGRRLKELAPHANIRVVPAGVDESFFHAGKSGAPIPGSVAMFGSFDWHPNRKALEWFVRDIFPRIVANVPQATLYIFGKQIPRQFQTKGGKNVVVRGLVADVKEELRRYQVVVVPLRVGGGMRLKILESFALGVPVVSTAIGAEGIECRSGEHLLVADTAAEFAGEVVRLLRDAVLRERLAHNAFSLVNQYYRWDRIAEQFELVYIDAVRGSLKRPARRRYPLVDTASNGDAGDV